MAAVAAAAVAVTETAGLAEGCTECAWSTGAGAGAVWGVEVGGILFSVMMPRNGILVVLAGSPDTTF